MTVSNDGDEPVTLRFRTGQRADFAAYGLDGETSLNEETGADKTTGADETAPNDEDDGVSDSDAPDPVWRHGAGKMFTQVLGTETLEAGDSVSYEAAWPEPPAGSYRVAGTLTAEESDIEATATVAVD